MRSANADGVVSASMRSSSVRGHRREVAQGLGVDAPVQHGVVRAAGGEPGLGRGRQRRARASTPRGRPAASAAARRAATTSISLATSRNRSPRSTRPTTTAGPGAASNTSRTGSSRPPMPSGWISQRGLAAAMRRADLEHVRAEDLRLARPEVVGVVLHERACRPAAPAPIALTARQQRRGLPVALAAEAVAVGHQPLHGEAGQLAQAAEVLEVRGEGAEAARRRGTSRSPASMRAA